jgi:hypothetical protein
MAVRVVAHIPNEDPFVADLEEMPSSTATNVYLTNLRTRDGKPVAWLTDRVRGILLPMHRLTFLEVVITQWDEREVEPFFKDQTKGY